MKRNLIVPILLAIYLPVSVYAQDFNKARMDSFFNILAEKNKAMGSVAISKNGTVLYSRAIGYSRMKGNDSTKATIDTRYRIGSVTKMFTAVMIFQMVEEGKISLRNPLSKYFPAIPNADNITIGNLLNHRSGIHNFTNDSLYRTYMTQPKTKNELLAIISGNKPDFKPNAKAAYSNSNYVLLGYIIEAVDKNSYEVSLRKRITGKAGLVATYQGKRTDLANKESYSYQFTNSWEQEPESDMSIPAGAGSLVSTPVELTKFIEALFGQELVSQNSLEQMKTITDGYGMGMFKIPFYDRMAYGHNGNIDGFFSTVAYFPGDSLAVAYCTNGQAYPFNDVLIGLLSIYFNTKNYTIPTFKTFALSATELDAYTGVYASPQMPLKLTISRSGLQLLGQGTGQAVFQLEAIKKDVFKFERAGIVIHFNTAKKELSLEQGGSNILFTRE